MAFNLFKGFVIFFLYVPIISLAQNAPDLYISNQGEDFYPGTSALLARKTLAATKPLLDSFAAFKGIVKVGLKSGSIFEENLLPTR